MGHTLWHRTIYLMMHRANQPKPNFRLAIWSRLIDPFARHVESRICEEVAVQHRFIYSTVNRVPGRAHLGQSERGLQLVHERPGTHDTSRKVR